MSKIEIESFCLGCGTVSKALVEQGDLRAYSGAPAPAWCASDECQVKRQIFNDACDNTQASLYQRLVNANCTIDHHESDLYVKKTPLAEVLVERYAASPENVKTFRDDIDDELWLEVPFAYEPFYKKPTVIVVPDKED